MTFQRLAFGVHDSEIVLVLELGLSCSSRLWTVTKRFSRARIGLLPWPRDYAATGPYAINVFGAGDAERRTPNGTYLRRGGFHRKNPKMPDPTGTALANGALQYRNIRYWAADSCL
jgi:hypothetical protein